MMQMLKWPTDSVGGTVQGLKYSGLSVPEPFAIGVDMLTSSFASH